MLDSTNTEPLTEAGLGEHKLGTELDRLAATELARMRRAIAAKERRVQAGYIAAALEAEAGTRYMPAELAAACGSAIHTALKMAGRMLLTADDYGDLRSDLIVAAIRHGEACEAKRGEAAAPKGERTGTGSPAEVLRYIARWERRPVALAAAIGHPDAARMPRREDLAGKGMTTGTAYLTGAARRMVADLAEARATAEKAPSEAEGANVPATEAASDTLSMAELADALKVTKRERWAMDAAAGVESSTLAAEQGKTTSAMGTALTKGRDALRARTSPEDLRALAAELRGKPHPGALPAWKLPMLTTRPLYPVERHAPIGAARATDVLRYIAAVETAIVNVPAEALERADHAMRWTAPVRPNAKAPRSMGGYLTADHPRATVKRDGRWAIVPAHGPYNVRTVPADLPTLDRRALIGPKYLRAMAAPARTLHTLPTRHRFITHPDNVSGAHAAADAYLPTPAPRPTGTALGWAHAAPDQGGRTVSGGREQGKPRQCHSGALTEAVRARLTATRHARINAARAAREAAREAARAAGRVTVLEAAERTPQRAEMSAKPRPNVYG